jgi:hypothetical protein
MSGDIGPGVGSKVSGAVWNIVPELMFLRSASIRESATNPFEGMRQLVWVHEVAVKARVWEALNDALEEHV